MKHGSHVLAHWSKLQGKIAPSSGEAELFSSNVGLSAFAGIVNLARELRGSDFAEGRLSHYVDASACKGILLRRGAGALKHLEVRDLWGQSMVKQYGIVVNKIPRSENPADVLASACAPVDFEHHLAQLAIVFKVIK